MSEIRYIISDASRMIDVEPHVLRYWEEELQLEIPRNEMGHRYYRPDDIKVLENVKSLKNQGLQLKAIRLVISNSNGIENFKNIENINIEEVNKSNDKQSNQKNLEEMPEEVEKKVVVLNQKMTSSVDTYSDKVVLFQNMIRDMLEDVVSKSNGELNKTLSYSISENVIKQMDYLMRMSEEKEDERFKKLDESIREVQKARREIGKKNKLQKLFG